MATNKKAISAYLPVDIEEYLTKYCTEYDITRKDRSGEKKPALGTAVVEILRIFFSGDNVPSPLPDNVPLLPSNVVTEDKLNEILSNLKKSNTVPSTLPSIVKKELSTVKSDLQSNVSKQVEIAIATQVSNLLDRKIEAAIEPLITEISQIKKELSLATNKPRVEVAKDLNASEILNNQNSKGRLLSGLDEAYDIAKERGLKISRNSFQSYMSKPEKAEEYKREYSIKKEGRGQKSQYYDLGCDD